MQHHSQSLTQKIDQMLKKYSANELSAQQQYIKSLPSELIEFLSQKKISVKELAFPIPRYIRVKPGTKITFKQLVQSLAVKQDQIIPIDSEFYGIDPNVKINHCELYQLGLIYGMDYSSCIPAKCLEVGQNMKVLQLCSAPGNKSMYLADCFQNIQIVGVQININRANIMKNLIKKYQLQDKIEVEICDGMVFDSVQKFDRVLIDAECTHEGSIKHIKKFMGVGKNNRHETRQEVKDKKMISKQQEKQYEQNNCNPYTSDIRKTNQWGVDDFRQRFLDQKKIGNLEQLQSGLLHNGFRLLKDNGILVYSTCSFDETQNENIITKFISQCKNAELMDCRIGLKSAVYFQNGSVQGTLRFCPSVSRCGGMFISKIRKIKPAHE